MPRLCLNSADLEIDRVERGLSANIETVALRTTEADVCHEFADRDRTEMHAVRRVAEHVAACRRPDVAGAVATKAVECAVGAGREHSRIARRQAVGTDRVCMDCSRQTGHM